MRKCILFIFIALLCGCALGAKMNANYKACIDDAECIVKMRDAGVTAQTVVDTGSGISWLGAVVGAITSVAVGVYGGSKLFKK
jgi:hypothetical protein